MGKRIKEMTVAQLGVFVCFLCIALYAFYVQNKLNEKEAECRIKHAEVEKLYHMYETCDSLREVADSLSVELERLNTSLDHFSEAIKQTDGVNR